MTLHRERSRLREPLALRQHNVLEPRRSTLSSRSTEFLLTVACQSLCCIDQRRRCLFPILFILSVTRSLPILTTTRHRQQQVSTQHSIPRPAATLQAPSAALASKLLPHSALLVSLHCVVACRSQLLRSVVGLSPLIFSTDFLPALTTTHHSRAKASTRLHISTYRLL